MAAVKVALDPGETTPVKPVLPVLRRAEEIPEAARVFANIESFVVSTVPFVAEQPEVRLELLRYPRSSPPLGLPHRPCGWGCRCPPHSAHVNPSVRRADLHLVVSFAQAESVAGERAAGGGGKAWQILPTASSNASCTSFLAFNGAL